MVIKRVCEWCGKEFAAKTVRTRFCSDRCSKTAYKHNKRLEFVSNFNLEASIRKKPDDGAADREIMTVKLASEYISIHVTTLYRYIRSGILKAIHLPGKTLVRKSDIEALFRALEKIPERSESPKEKKPAVCSSSLLASLAVNRKDFVSIFGLLSFELMLCLYYNCPSCLL